MTRHVRLLGLLIGALLLFDSVAAQGQGVPKVPTVPTVPNTPNPNQPQPQPQPGQGSMTPQQIWQMRALQSRGGGSRGVQRGSPQIFGPGPFANPQPTIAPSPQQVQQQQKDQQKKAASDEKKATLRARVEQQKREAEQQAIERKRKKAEEANK